MRILKRVFISLLAIVAVLAIIGMMLPREISIARSIQIDAPAAKIYPHVANLSANVPWSPWLHHDPQTKLTYNDIPMGLGATMAWDSEHKNVGSGSLEITKVVENSHITTALDFGDMGGGSATWDFVEADGKTTATWGMSTDMGAGPVGRLFGVVMKRMIAADYDEGLGNLKALVEAD